MDFGNSTLQTIENAERYTSRKKLNPNWDPNPRNQWGVVSGSCVQTIGLPEHLGIEVIQRGKVPDYAEKVQSQIEDGKLGAIESIYNIYFIPTISESDARRKSREIRESRIPI